jgi:hypothetical protein
MAVPNSTLRREFLGWDEPSLQEAARRLCTHYRRSDALDLDRVIIVVPGQRAGRRLQELLAFLAEDENLQLTPPQVVTEGGLPEKLYSPKLPFADEVVQHLAWAIALRDLPAQEREHIVPQPPADGDTLRWLELGKVIGRVHVELAADGLDFAAVEMKGPNLGHYTESDRWKALGTVQKRYLQLLDQRKLWDKQTARLKAIEYGETHTDCDIILLGSVDLNTTLRQMLDRIAERVTAYVVAPEALADSFDRYGCLVPSAWCNARIPLSDEQLREVDGPAEQADAVTRWLSQLGGQFSKDEVAIGVPDESLVPQLQRQLEQCGTRARWVEGVRLGETGPFRLLNAAVRFAAARRYEDLAELLRHPEVEDWLGKRRAEPKSGRGGGAVSLPAQLDEFYNTHLPSRVRGAQDISDYPDWPDLAPAVKCIDTWLDRASSKHPLRAWGDIFRAILSAVYGGRTLRLDAPADEALHGTIRRILDACDRLASIPEALDIAPLSADEAFQVALGPLADETLPPPADSDALEILGWLELSLDDSPALIVTSFNEGFVPRSAGADAFLPDRLRRQLGLLHNERRYARDAYATSVLCHSRKELRLLIARRDTAKDPLEPSRLIFACADEKLIGRAKRFFGAQKAEVCSRRPVLAWGGPIPERSSFEVPRPAPLGARPQHFSVTEFKEYLACPYRYYLHRICKLVAIDDAARELDGGAFGTLLHRTLGIFGRDAGGTRDEDREQVIFTFLADQLSTLAERIYGPDQRRPAIWLQLEQARHRLRAFAARQSELRRTGWRIIYAEDEEKDRLSAPFVVDDEPVTLVGRIDRIDYHESERKIRIVDYKTADRARSPEETHRAGEKWTDLQLPLYRHLWRTAIEVPAACAIEVAYFNLPKTEDKKAIVVAQWDDAIFAESDDVARWIVRCVREEAFWPPVYPAPDYSDDLAAICLDNVIAGPALADETEGGSRE